MQRIAFFDFDGTITHADTMVEMIKFCKGFIRFYIGLVLLSPVLIAFKLHLISNQKAKSVVLQYFFGGINRSVFENQCQLFATQRLPSLIRKKAMIEIELLKAIGTTVVIVSASAENWLKAWCQQHQLLLIGTKLKEKKDTISGAIDGRNCYGVEKTNRIQQQFNVTEYDQIFCYGDTPGDKPMLALGSIAFYKPFR
jgi:phosphatidylglycerophosphatase C